MATMTLYSFEDEDGQPDGTWTTTDINEAREHARRYRLAIVEETYEYTDSTIIEDYRTDEAKRRLGSEMD